MSGGGGRYPSSHVQRGWYHTVAGSNFWTRDGFCCNVTNKYLYRFGEKSIITTRKRTCGKVMFLHLSVILFMGGVWLWVWGYTPLWSHPLDTPPRHTHPGHPLDIHILGHTHTPGDPSWTHTPLNTHTPRHTHTLDTHPTLDTCSPLTVNKQTVRILLECFLVLTFMRFEGKYNPN